MLHKNEIIIIMMMIIHSYSVSLKFPTKENVIKNVSAISQIKSKKWLISEELLVDSRQDFKETIIEVMAKLTWLQNAES